MSSTLFDYEWQFLLQMSTRINYCAAYDEVCATFMQQIQTLIPYYTGIAFQAGRENGRVTLGNPLSTEPLDDSSDHGFFIDGRYPHWDGFIMSPNSTVFRQSDIIPPAKWEKTRVYRDVWLPKGIFWGLFVSLVHKDVPLAVLGIFREKSDPDFSARDIFIMNTLKDPVERKFFSLLESREQPSKPNRLLRTAAAHGLTKRETEIVSLVCGGRSSEEMCQQLYISHATLSKHLSNIYTKTKTKNRTQLFVLFGDN